MDAESFFARWSRRKTHSGENEPALADGVGLPAGVHDPAPPAAMVQPAKPTEPVPAPTLEDVARLTHESDFTPFVARGVDETVRRSAMKKLFSDPQFNLMDGLDIYVGDYHTFEPIPPAMLALLNHAQALLNPLAHLEGPLMRLVQAPLEETTEPDTDVELAPRCQQAELPQAALQQVERPVAPPDAAAPGSAPIDQIDPITVQETPGNDDPI
jgi:hypothetical protein